jgi:hypothetical protein
MAPSGGADGGWAIASGGVAIDNVVSRNRTAILDGRRPPPGIANFLR